MRFGSFASGAQPGMGHGERTATPWWAWPSSLALDGPVVAVSWLWAIGRQMGHPVSVGPLILVAAAVWLTYVADRLLDLRRLDSRSGHSRAVSLRPSRRHVFFARYRRRFGWSWLWVFGGALAWGAVSLSPVAFTLGMLVAALAVATIVWSDRSSAAGMVGRCIAIGVAFAGAIVVGLDAPGDAGLWAPLLGFGAVCTSNLAWVSAWERRVRDGHPTHPRAPRMAHGLSAAALLVVTAWWFTDPSLLVLAAMGALIGCWLLEFAGPGPTPQARSAAADLVLIVPLLVVLI